MRLLDRPAAPASAGAGIGEGEERRRQPGLAPVAAGGGGGDDDLEALGGAADPSPQQVEESEARAGQ